MSNYRYDIKRIPHHLRLIHRILTVNIRHDVGVLGDSLDENSLGICVNGGSGWTVGLLLLLGGVQTGFHSLVSGVRGESTFVVRIWGWVICSLEEMVKGIKII